MTANRALVKLTVLPLRWSDLKLVPTEQRSLFVCLCYTVSELNAAHRLALLSLHSFPGDRALEAAALVQRNFLIRTVSSKCFEFLAFLERVKIKSQDNEVKNLVKELDKSVSELTARKGYAIAEHVRNKTAFHLDYGQAKTAVRADGDHFDCNLYLTEARGNSVYPVGEFAIYANSLEKSPAEAKHSITSEADHSEWVEWESATVDLANEIHALSFERFVHPMIPDRRAHRKDLWIAPDLVGERGVDRSPLFLWVAK